MADNNESSEPKQKIKYKQQPEEKINFSAKPVAAPQKQKSQNWFTSLFRPVQKQELVVTNEQKPAQKKEVAPDIAKDLQAAAMTNQAVKASTSMIVDQANGLKQQPLTAKQNLAKAETAGLNKDVTAAASKVKASQEIQTGVKPAVKQQLKVDEATKPGIKTGQGALAAKEQLSAKESVTKKASITKGEMASETKNLAANKVKLSAAKKLSTNEKLADGNVKKPPTGKRVRIEDNAGGKSKVIKLNNDVQKRVSLNKKKPRQQPVMPEVVVSTNAQGEVNKISISAFGVPQPTSQAVSRGYKQGQTNHKTARVVSASKKKINNRNENKEQNLSFQMRR